MNKYCRKWPPCEPVKPQSAANMCCALALDVDAALSIWRTMHITIARRAINLIPESRAAQELFVAAKRGELPLWNQLP